MGHSELDSGLKGRRPWNADRKLGAKRALKPLRRTKAPIVYKQTGNLRAVQILLGHTKIESSLRYLRVDVEDALTL